MNDRVSETANGDPDESSRLLSLPEAAEWLNVHYMTAYRWVRRGDLPAFKTGGRLRVRQADLEHFLADRQLDLAVGDRPATATNWQRRRERLIASLLAGDAAQARSEVRKVISDGATAGDVYIHLFTPALHDIGRRWADGNIGVGEEHRASQICVTIIAQLGGLFRRRGPVRGTAVALTPPDEQHAIASAMLADFLRASGYSVHHLGAGIPASDLALFLRVVPADLVCFSVTHRLAADQYAALMDACRQSRTDTVVIFGGQGVDAAAATAAGGVVVTDLRELGDHLERG